MNTYVKEAEVRYMPTDYITSSLPSHTLECGGVAKVLHLIALVNNSSSR